MSDNQYQVTLTGKLAGSTHLEQAATEFAQLFKTTPELAKQTLQKGRVTIKKNINKAAAIKVRNALDKIGIGCRILTAQEAAAELAALAQQKKIQIEKASTSSTSIDSTPIDSYEPPADHPGLQFKIEGKPDYSFVTVQLPANRTLKVEASAMATMDTHIEMKTKLKGGLGRFVTGESIFINEFTATHGPGEIGIAPGAPGDMAHIYLDGDILYLQNSAFVASAMNVNIESKWQGFTKGFFSGENLFLIRASGKGDLWFNSYGAIIEIDVQGNYVVDTGNIVAFTEQLDYKISKVGGYKSLFFSGEGFVCRFSGQGKVWIQTRGVDAFAWWAHTYRPSRSSG
ncbi:TIGR00266 family protein [Spartinivicinus poritis]|uniref:TIGR00266 family protein n=1 Tax=Spartinivicinus poritis TaxID=2994640 RepID=A0ABT5UF59_9GAMM|nr:TIGR00266 family protein [Spartinivicinus sp. A2-2]MDE1463724.1 TIGR00266 family protein [Spartinivicinus sp. A2-2]